MHYSLLCVLNSLMMLLFTPPSPPPHTHTPTHTLSCSLILYFPFSLSATIVLGFLSVLTPFALIVYARYSLVMAGCMTGSISAIPRTAIVSFASSSAASCPPTFNNAAHVCAGNNI